ARHATAAAGAGEPDQALEIARTAAGIAVETRSARMRRELVTLQRAMRPWQDAPVGRDLDEVLASVTEGN
ncbi:Twin-arginine translocation pathway signal, partial [Streptomyces sp. NPDC005538]